MRSEKEVGNIAVHLCHMQAVGCVEIGADIPSDESFQDGQDSRRGIDEECIIIKGDISHVVLSYPILDLFDNVKRIALAEGRVKNG